MKTFKKYFQTFILMNVCMQFSGAQIWVHNEILGRPKSNEITMQLMFGEDAEINIKYGTASGVYTDQTGWKPAYANQMAQYVIQNLLPNSTYYYRIQYRKPGQGTYAEKPEHFFNTQKSKSTEFTFVVQADPHLDELSDTALYARCLRNQLEDKPDFMVDLGDILMSDKLRNNVKIVTHDTVIYRAKLMRQYYEYSCHSVPLFMTIGNHEGECGWYQNNTPENVAIWGSNERKKYFLNPEPDGFYSGDTTNNKWIGRRASYYAWTWGDALFVVIDPYWNTKIKPDSLNGWRWSLGKIQYDWLRKTLETSDAKYKFIFSHQLVGGDEDGRGGVEFCNQYEWGGNNLDGSRGWESQRPGWYKPIKEILKENNATIFFHGHDHFFGKQQNNCLIYQETPQPSHPNFTSTTYALDYGYKEGVILPNSGHLRVTVSANGVRVEYVRAYLPKNENANRHNKDVSASYFLPYNYCYDTLSVGVPIVWNEKYASELIYPNPASTDANIQFELKSADNVSIFIYDANGHLIKTLLNNYPSNRGKYLVNWDLKDNTNQAIKPGMYYYQIVGNKHAKSSGKIQIHK